jgi:hypothetical protein
LTLILEVSDKEATWIPGLWLTASILGGIGLMFARRWRWAALPFVCVQVIGLWVTLGELHDPYIGPAIVVESGSRWYAWHLWLSSAIGTLLPLVGALLPRRTT